MLLQAGADANARYFDGAQLSLLDPKQFAYVIFLIEKVKGKTRNAMFVFL